MLAQMMMKFVLSRWGRTGQDPEEGRGFLNKVCMMITMYEYDDDNGDDDDDNDDYGDESDIHLLCMIMMLITMVMMTY